MSRETSKWLNTMTLIGQTDRRGMAWHYRIDEQEHIVTASGREYLSNHYTGPIPVADVEDRLFAWEPASGPVMFPVLTGITETGEPIYSYSEIPNKKRIYPSDDETHTFGIFSDSYQPHGFSEWLIGNVSNILSDTLQVSSAGLLKGRAVAWVEVSVPENVLTPEGVTFRPNLLSTTSLDGTIATTLKRTVTATVCDNTLSMALCEDSQTYKRRHTAMSNSKEEQDRARAALDLLTSSADEVSQEIARLCEWDITNTQFDEIMRLSGLDPRTGKAPESKRGITIAERKAEEIRALYRNDQRVAPWTGTAFGVLQAFNTWEHHVKATKGDTNRAERNMLAAIKGDTDKADRDVIDLITRAYETV